MNTKYLTNWLFTSYLEGERMIGLISAEDGSGVVWKRTEQLIYRDKNSVYSENTRYILGSPVSKGELIQLRIRVKTKR